MSTPQTAQVFIKNATDGTATVTLWHNNSSYGTETQTWTLAPGQVCPNPLTVHFDTGFGSWSVLDYWACEIAVEGGSTPGLYESSGILQYSNWKECQLQSPDAGKNLQFWASSTDFYIGLVSGPTSTPMNPVVRSSAQVYVTNTTDSPAWITLFHNNSTDGTQSGTWYVPEGGKAGPLTVYFRVGLNVAEVLDYWAVKLVVQQGADAGVYQSSGSIVFADWKECQLESPDAGQTLPFSVSTSTFDINMPSGGTSTGMNQTGPYTLADNVFVLMLENHSFDNIFAFSGIPGITAATTANSNSYNGTTYNVGSSAPDSMPTDPGHEFADVVEQLCGQGVSHTPWTPYSDNLNNGGFVANYATTKSEITSNNPNLPTPSEYGDIMQCFDTPNQLPVIYQLATTFAICDQWHSSIPGPTWPNRFFVHGASSGGWADSPASSQIVTWEAPGGGFVYPNGSSIYDKLTAKGLQWRIYEDENGPVLGSIPQVAALRGITYGVNTNSIGALATDLQGPYPYAYTFIEPNYGDTSGGSYVGGSSQHPMDSVIGGEALIKMVYEAIRNSPAWERSLLIITYDEHGGFYDSVSPGPASSPDDGSPQDISINSGGFLFDRYGVRVPAVVVSPLVPAGTVDHTLYDHAAVSATLQKLFGVTAMTQRDSGAHDVLGLLSLTTPRTDCPTTLNNPASAVNAAAPAPAADLAAQPLPDSGNLQGFVQILAKTDIELQGGTPAAVAAVKAKVASLKTVADAEAYANDVTARAKQAGGTPPPPPRQVPAA